MAPPSHPRTAPPGELALIDVGALLNGGERAPAPEWGFGQHIR